MDGSLAKAHLKSCAPVKPPKNSVSVSCQKKSLFGFKMCSEESFSYEKLWLSKHHSGVAFITY